MESRRRCLSRTPLALAIAPLLLLLTFSPQTRGAEIPCDIQAKGAICLFDGRKVMVPDAARKGATGHWDFDGNVATDASGKRNHQVDAGFVPGPGLWGRGSSAYLKGYGGHIRFPHSPSLTFDGEFSLSLWTFPVARAAAANDDKWCAIVSKGDGAPRIEVHSKTRKIRVKTSSGEVKPATSRASLGASRWTHLAVTKSNDRLRLYVNGVPELSTAITADSVKVSTDDLVVGDKECAFPMYVDELRTYDAVLEEDEIAAEGGHALGGDGQGFRIGCVSCTKTEAKESCEENWHICTKLELYAGGYRFAKAMGYVSETESAVWGREEATGVGSGSSTKGSVVCCKD